MFARYAEDIFLREMRGLGWIEPVDPEAHDWIDPGQGCKLVMPAVDMNELQWRSQTEVLVMESLRRTFEFLGEFPVARRKLSMWEGPQCWPQLRERRDANYALLRYISIDVFLVSDDVAAEVLPDGGASDDVFEPDEFDYWSSVSALDVCGVHGANSSLVGAHDVDPHCVVGEGLPIPPVQLSCTQSAAYAAPAAVTHLQR